MSRNGVSVNAEPSSPADESGDNLSNWGSGLENENAHQLPTSTARRTGASGQHRQRRLSAPSREQTVPLGGVAARASRARRGTREDSTVAIAGARGDSISNINREGAVRVKAREANGGIAIGGDHRPGWNQSSRQAKGRRGSQEKYQPQHPPSQAHQVEYAAPIATVGGNNIRRKKRNSVGSAGSAGREHTAAATTSLAVMQQAEIELEAAAPSQEEIRVMIERIRWETDCSGVVGASNNGSHLGIEVM